MGEFMNPEYESEDEKFENFLSENQYERVHGEFYICPGDHLWTSSDIYELYQESIKRKEISNKTFAKFMSKLTFKEGDNQ